MATNYTSGDYQIVLATKIDTKQLKQQIQEINNKPPSIKIEVKITEKALERVKELNKLLGETQALNNYTSALKNIQETMKSYEKIASKTATASKHVSDAVTGMVEVSKKGKKEVNSLSDSFGKFAKWQIVGDIIHKVKDSLKELVNVSIELDTAYIDLQKVTSLAADDFDMITNKAYTLGQTVAKTTTEAIQAMTEFSRGGYTIQESTGILAQNALMWTNIADGTVSTAESAEMMIAVMKAFNIQANDTLHILDALNEVSNSFAVSSGDLSNSLTKSSAVLANAGVSFEQQLGLITAGTEVLRNANTVSQGKQRSPMHTEMCA